VISIVDPEELKNVLRPTVYVARHAAADPLDRADRQGGGGQGIGMTNLGREDTTGHVSSSQRD
jgi:hypothetical protein